MPRPTPPPRPAAQFWPACCLALILVLVTGVVTAVVVVAVLLVLVEGGHLPTVPENERAALPSPPSWKYEASVTANGAKVYLFNGTSQPPLALTKDGAVASYDEVNRVLAALQLPPVTRNVPELETITGSRVDRAKFRWDDYPLGELTVCRTLGRNPNPFGGEFRDVIWKVTVSARPAKK